MLRKLLIVLSPIALLILLEAIFAAGIWEPMAQPGSHAGTSIRLKRALAEPALESIDYVTLGSSRAEYGLDHAAFAARAKKLGRVHADLSMPGSHWMTVGILSRWLQREHPEVQGGIIALSIQDLMYAGNGDYELGIVAPFRRPGDLLWIAEHVPFQRGNLASYGIWSALFGWRSDIQAFVRNPSARMESIEWYAANRASPDRLFDNQESPGDMCAFGLDNLDVCDRIGASTQPTADSFKRQCRELQKNAADQHDYHALMQAHSVASFQQRTRALVQAQLREVRWTLPPIVVLMPLPPLWQRDVLGPGLREWALEILQPLADDGTIRLIDATAFFDSDGDSGCSAFFDFYHQNAHGRERFGQWLLPQLDSMLYQTQGGPPLPPSPALMRPVP